MSQKPDLFLNPVQARSYLIAAKHETTIAGRGTGKSEGIIAPRIIRWATEMPRGLIVGEAATYQQHLTRTLPAIFAGMEKWGWVNGRDYFFGRYAPEAWKWAKPFITPLRPEYFIHLKTGAGIVLVSHDRPGSANGISACAVFGDEAKYLKRESHKSEVIPILRGMNHVFGNSSSYQSTLLTTDMPVSDAAQWLIEEGDMRYTKEMRERVAQVVMMEQEKAAKLAILRDESRKGEHKNAREVVSQCHRALHRLRCGDASQKEKPLFYFQEASSLENIHVLGAEYFINAMDEMSNEEFATSLLNRRRRNVVNGFYPLLKEEVHGYDAFNNGFLDSLGNDLNYGEDTDSRQDADVDPDMPLDISIDYNAQFNCMVIGQASGNVYRLVNSLHVRHPLMLRDLVLKFKHYYRHHRDKYVRFYYDHTAKFSNASMPYNYYEEVEELLRDRQGGSWNVDMQYVGHTPSYQTRFELWNKILRNDRMTFLYNRINAEFWSNSCMLAGIKRTSKGYEKDKTNERKAKHSGAYERATHYSDAGDILVYGALTDRFEL
ncbi:hypothetical protein UFOVP350_13 [uncultured Caudovirales phage]|uniref:Uncharacterized protein n=1 Tax=uncultured Caudovirales phage TaxID=2100421 RepID=A0A6J5M1H1_9CAUD|nr:hypothetical protein UFOVP350_13 [uncultured Caudovirales phage]